MLDKFEIIFEKALVESLVTATAIMVVFIRSILFFNFCFGDLTSFVRGVVVKHGPFLLKHSSTIFALKSMNESFAHLLLQSKAIMIPRPEDEGEEQKEDTGKSVGDYLLGLLFMEHENGNISDDTVHQLLDSYLDQMNHIDHSHYLKKILHPYLSELLGLASRSVHPQLQNVVMQLLGLLLDLTVEENRNIQLSYRHDATISSSDPQETEITSTSQNDLSYFSGIALTDLKDSSIGPEMTRLHWERCLKTLDETLQKSRNVELDHLLPRESDRPVGTLVTTPTTLENISRVKTAASTKTPLLLQGPAGVGKTATISEASFQSGNSKKLIRVNLSPQTSIEDLIGKMMMIPSPDQGQKESLMFVPYPFTIAFRDGHWLLLDELNLAPDNVLQALESAIDSGILILPDMAVGDAFPSRYIKMDPNFRVFATQNPHSGYFKNAREKLSSSFLDRFLPVNFEELPENEWFQIIQFKLKERGVDDHTLADQISVTIVRDHHALCKLFRGPTFPERSSYSDISIRELLKVVDHLAIHYRCQPELLRQPSTLRSLVGLELWNIYGARFRALGQNEVRTCLTRLNHTCVIQPMSWDITPDAVIMDDIRRDHFFPAPNAIPNCSHSPDLVETVLQINEEVMKMMFTKEFILQHGIYFLARSWVSHWLQLQSDRLLEDGCCLYLQKFVHQEARQMVLAIFQKHAISPSPTKLNFEIGAPDKSYAVTQDSLIVWKQLMISVLAQNPLRPESFLLVGKDGCGKSDCLRAFAALVGRSLEELCVMPETEPSAFIGQFLPNENITPSNGSRVVWVNGVVTNAFQNGHWLLIDNFSQAESSVLERLNPVLEQPPELTLIEAGHSTPETIHPGYCLFATMTPPIAGGGEGQGSELSPALNNRFTVMYMENICGANSEEIFMTEILKICRVSLPESWFVRPGSAPLSACHLLTTMAWMTLQRKVLSTFTLRNICRMINFAFLISRSPEMTISMSVWTAFSMTVVAQILPSKKTDGLELVRDVHRLLKSFDHHWVPLLPNFIESQFGTDFVSTEYVLTESRRNYAQILLACISCRVSILLEGGAATGKTTLVLALAKWKNIKVERVNNTDGTTVQDYLGCYLPDGKGFVFKKGPLYRAMENGHWFLADEFNLADPSVMNLLVPLLEGKTSIKVAGSNREIQAHPDFRFFATQNGSQYANRKK
jgi:MoxR-like ATPase